MDRAQFYEMRDLYNKLEKGQNISREEIYPFVEDKWTRVNAYRLLAKYGILDLFPSEYLSFQKAAEANLCWWLRFPSELDAIPDEIEHVKQVSFDSDGKQNFVYYEVFKFRTDSPHWASEKGWMIGVVGPYYDYSKPYDFPGATYSRLKKIMDITPEEEVKWAYENRSKF